MPDINVTVGVKTRNAEQGLERVQGSLDKIERQARTTQQALNKLSVPNLNSNSLTSFKMGLESLSTITRGLQERLNSLGITNTTSILRPLSIVDNKMQSLVQSTSRLQTTLNSLAITNTTSVIRPLRLIDRQIGQMLTEVERISVAINGLRVNNTTGVIRPLQIISRKLQQLLDQTNMLQQSLNSLRVGNASTIIGQFSNISRRILATNNSLGMMQERLDGITLTNENEIRRGFRRIRSAIDAMNRSAEQARGNLGDLRGPRGGGGGSRSQGSADQTTRISNQFQAQLQGAADRADPLGARLRELNRDMRNLERSFNSGAISAQRFARGQNNLLTQIANVEETINRQNFALSRMGRFIAGNNFNVQNMTTLTQEANIVTQRFGDALRYAARGALLFLGTLATRDLIAVNKEMESLVLSLNAIGGSSEEGAKHLAFLKQTADELGFTTKDLAKGFKLLTANTAGTALQGETTNAIFQSFTATSRALGTSTADLEGIFRALGQMMSKGTVKFIAALFRNK